MPKSEMKVRIYKSGGKEYIALEDFQKITNQLNVISKMEIDGYKKKIKNLEDQLNKPRSQEPAYSASLLRTCSDCGLTILDSQWIVKGRSSESDEWVMVCPACRRGVVFLPEDACKYEGYNIIRIDQREKEAPAPEGRCIHHIKIGHCAICAGKTCDNCGNKDKIGKRRGRDWCPVGGYVIPALLCHKWKPECVSCQYYHGEGYECDFCKHQDLSHVPDEEKHLYNQDNYKPKEEPTLES